MTFLQFASNNVKRNARAYTGYLLSSSFAVMIFFIYALFYFHPDLTGSALGEMAKLGMKAAEYVIYIVSFLFVLYSVSAFLKARQKEFGILSILGAADRQIHSLIFLENMIIGFVAILLGIGSGLVLAKLFLLMGAKVLEMDELSFYLPWKAAGLTLAAFFALFFVISLLSIMLVRKNKVLELLQGSQKPKPEPKASVLLALLALVCLIAPLVMMHGELSNVTMAVSLLLTVVGTYFFFTQTSVLAVRLLKRNRGFFWRGTNLIWVSEMAYKIKDNARMFFLVTIVTTMSCSAVSLVLSLKQGNEEMYLSTPYAISYNIMSGGKGDTAADVKKIDEELRQAGISYVKAPWHGLTPAFQEVSGYYQIVGVSEYNEYAKLAHFETVQSVAADEAVWFSSTKHVEGQSQDVSQALTLPDKGVAIAHVRQADKKVDEYFSVVVVADDTFQRLKAIDNRPMFQNDSLYYFVPAWPNEHAPSKYSEEVQVTQHLTALTPMRDGKVAAGYVRARAEQYMQLKQSTNIISFIGAFIAAIFSISTASFLYFKLYTDLNQDQASYRALSKIGLSTREMRKASTIQMAALFFIPLVVAGIESLASLSALQTHMSGLDIFVPTLIAIAAFFGLQVVYFVVVRSRYLSQLRRVMV